MARQKLSVTMLEGPPLEAATLTFMCTADRIAFERHFQTSSAVISAWSDLFDQATGQAKPGADLRELREEWIAFFAWRALGRALNGRISDFASFVESVDEITIEGLGEDADPNPTTAAQPSTS